MRRASLLVGRVSVSDGVRAWNWILDQCKTHGYTLAGSGPTAIHSLPFRALAYPLDDDQDGDALTVAR